MEEKWNYVKHMAQLTNQVYGFVSQVALDIGGCFTVAFASGTPLSLFDAASEMCGVHRGLQVLSSRHLL